MPDTASAPTDSVDLDWPRSAPPPLSAARLRAAPEDFQVDERLDIVPTGAGEHAWLRIRKRGLNTEDVAKQLARIAGVKRVDVGYAGLKDRHAVTTQWFSVRLPGRADPDWPARLPPGAELLDAARHARKLHSGAHTGNAFAIVLRDCSGDRDALAERILGIVRRGVPNYFGEQRFGHGGANIARARALFAGREPVKDPKRRGLYLSAARALLFNAILAERVRRGCWDRPLAGEVFILNGTRSFFAARPEEPDIAARLERGDIHPSGALWGAGEPPTADAVREIETGVAATHADLARGLAAAGLKQERRALRVLPARFTAEWLDATALGLRFTLPAGSYATAVLRELAVYAADRP